MGFEKVEYNFPLGEEEEKEKIEVEALKEVKVEKPSKKEPEEIEIEVVEDTPQKDLNEYGKPIKKSKPPSEVTDEELDEYSTKVQKRIKHFSKVYHDERREKEKAIRERVELENLTRQLVEENKSLKDTNSKSKNALLEQAKRTAAGEALLAKRAYKQAYDAGDAEKLVEAQEKLTAAKIKVDKLDNYKPTKPLQEKQNQVQIPPEPTESFVDHRAQEWARKNTWFGPNGNPEMTGYAKGLHDKLVNIDRVSPASDEYYETIDSRMRQLFPDQFDEEETKPKRQSNVVAPATRSTSPRKVTLNKTQIALAKRLGVPLEEYARQQAALNMRKD